MKKKLWLIPLGVVVLIALLVLVLHPRTQLLPNDAAEEPGEEWMIPDEEVPLAQSAVPPADPYAGLNETQIQYVKEVLRLVNEARAAQGLNALRLDPALRSAAQVRASECVTVFSHTRPDGTSYKTAVAQAGVVSNYLGENAASGQTTPKEAVEGWLDSSGHRANILNQHFTRIGIGLAENTGGYYGGYAWVQLFSNG